MFVGIFDGIRFCSVGAGVGNIAISCDDGAVVVAASVPDHDVSRPRRLDVGAVFECVGREFLICKKVNCWFVVEGIQTTRLGVV